MRTRLWPWLLISAIWIGAVAIAAANAWPTVPLDIPARDPEVQAALARAVRAHVLKFGAIGLVPVVLACGILWRRRR